jgi:tryptophan-rich sensory protein
MKKQNIKLFIISLIPPLLIGFIGSLLTTPSIDTWYANLNKPSFNPPNWIFSPVWTTLFILMGIALFLVVKEKIDYGRKKRAMAIFFFQLALNIFWSYSFFFLHNPLLAFVVIVFLFLAILLNIITFFKISKPAGYLLIPYIVWVSFAGVLNFFIFYLN